MAGLWVGCGGLGLCVEGPVHLPICILGKELAAAKA